MAKFLGSLPSQVSTNADLGSMSQQDSDSVIITGGNIVVSDDTTANPYQDTSTSMVKPVLNLDFCNGGRLDPRITFNRASTATYYDGKTNVIAEQNLLTYSQQFELSNWVKAGMTIIPNTSIAPDGTLTAAYMYPNATGNMRSIYQATSGANTISIYVKPNGFNYFWMINNTGGTIAAWFNLSNGTVGTVVSQNYTATISAQPNGFYKCSLTSLTGNIPYCQFGVTDADNNQVVTPNGTSGVYIWGAQSEQRSSASAYTPTTTQAITNYIPQLMTANNNTPRFDYDPIAGSCNGLLIEEARTNLLTYSSDYTNAAWAKTAGTIQTNSIVAPDGSLTASKLLEPLLGRSELSYLTSVVSGTNYTFSIYAKENPYASKRFISIATSSGGFGSQSVAIFDLATGLKTFDNGNGISYSIISVGNGWWRITNTDNATVTSSANIIIYSSNSPISITSSGDGYSGIYVWGAQLEAGSFATSYIPTVASQVTRAADIAKITGTNLSNFYNAAEGTFYVEGNSIGGYLFSTADATNSGAMSLYAYVTTSYIVQSWNSNSLQANLNTGINYLLNSKLAIAYSLNNFGISGNGGNILFSNNYTQPAVTTFNIGSAASSTVGLNYIKNIKYYNKRLINVELVEMTSV